MSITDWEYQSKKLNETNVIPPQAPKGDVKSGLRNVLKNKL
jgi:hypothetical protein